MKKLTATIFATLLTVVSVNAANAEIASKGYVDDKVGDVSTQVAQKADQTALEALSGRVDTNETSIGTIGSLQTSDKTNLVGAVNELKTGLDTKLDTTTASETYATKTALSDGLATKADTTALTAKQDVSKKVTGATVGDHAGSDDMYTSVSAAEKIAQDAVDGVTGNISGLTERVTTAEGEIDALQTGKADKATSLAGYGITDAYTKGESDGKYATAAQGALADTALQKQGVLTQGNLLTTDESGKIIDAGKKGALASKDTVSAAEIDAGAVSKDKLDSGVQASLDKADTALQDADLTELEGKVDKNTSDIAGKVSTSQGAENANKAVITGADGNITTGAVTKTMLDSTVQETLNKADQAATDLTELEGRVETNTTNIGTVGSLTTEQKTDLVVAINEVDANANAAQSAAEAAQTTANAAIPKPDTNCTATGAKCVLVTNGTNFEWEIIQRGSSEGGQP